MPNQPLSRFAVLPARRGSRSPRLRIALPALLLALTLARGAGAVAAESAPTPLLELATPLDPARLDTEEGAAVESVTRTDPAGEEIHALRIRVPGGTNWPGVHIRLATADAPLDLSGRGAVHVRIHNRDKRQRWYGVRLDNPGSTGGKNCYNHASPIAAGAVGTIIVPLYQAPLVVEPARAWRGMKGVPAGHESFDPARVVSLFLFLDHPRDEHRFDLLGATVVGETKIVPADTALPLIDRFGQVRHLDWPGKVSDESELIAARRAEAKDLAAHAGPADWNRYGGWATGPSVKATGHFYPLRRGGRWWLVDPAGKLFWSNGICVVQQRYYTPVGRREAYFAWLPEADSPFAAHYDTKSGAASGFYKDQKDYRIFRFDAANRQRKYGPDWEPIHAGLVHRRFRSWGINTIANWSDPAIYQLRQTPYCTSNHPRTPKIPTSTGLWGQFPDPFHPDYEPAVRTALALRASSAEDPWCIGYFIDNELGWGKEHELGAQVLACPPEQPAKVAALALLRARYETIAALNAAWDTEHASWEALAAAVEPPALAKARADLEAITEIIAERYFATNKRIMRELAPRKLYLGCRMHTPNHVASQAAARHCDVLSYNLYRRGVADWLLPNGLDMPVIVSEWHFGATDRGHFKGGLQTAIDQDDRARQYDHFLRQSIAHPSIVGAHWFQYQDQHASGRNDGENFQVGFVSITDRPYPRMVRAARAIAADLYTLRATGARSAPRGSE